MAQIERKRYIGYHRVSTQRQGESGLGLEAQRAAVAGFVNGHGELIGEFTEVESGKRVDRPELAKALAQAKRGKATLVVAKLDRLARNVAFLSAMMDSTVPFVACDNPHANRLTLHILAAVAEAEAVAISQRTKAALAAYKARGGKLGAQNSKCRSISIMREASQRGQVRGALQNKVRAREAYVDLILLMQGLRAAGRSLQQISGELNRMGHSTRTGKPWGPVQVMRALRRAETEK